MHPVEQHWLPRGRRERIEDATATAVLRALNEQTGDVLVFLPGIGEIHRTKTALDQAVGPSVDVYPLAGALSLAEQDRALAPSPPGRRRVVLSTDIAETSLTVDGVRVVVDSGLARAPRFDTRTGMSRLTTITTSRASAEQRAGRAGRVEPGACYRLWSKIEHGTRAAHRAAEIEEVDLSGLALELAVWGTPADDLAFITTPPAKAMRAATELLTQLGAIDDDGRPTDIGRKMLGLPVHPRLARMLVAEPSALGCALAVLIDERDVLRGRPDDLPADLSLRLQVLTGRAGHDRADRGAVATSPRPGGRSGSSDADPVRHRSDRRRPGRCRAAPRVPRPARSTATARPVPAPHRLRCVAPRHRPARPRIVRRRGRPRRQAGSRPHPTRCRTRRRRRRPHVRRRDRRAGHDGVGRRPRRPRRAGRAPPRLDATRRDQPPPATRRGDHRGADAASPSDGSGRARLVDRVGRSAPTRRLPAPHRAARRGPTGAWSTSRRRSTSGSPRTCPAPWAAATSSRSTWRWCFDRSSPGRKAPNSTDSRRRASNSRRGAPSPIDYSTDEPTASVRVQDLFGTTVHPMAGGRPIVLHLLSPADRPIQITADLPGFWAGTWADVRKDLAGRYPKHQWPDDPATATPKRLKDR